MLKGIGLIRKAHTTPPPHPPVPGMLYWICCPVAKMTAAYVEEITENSRIHICGGNCRLNFWQLGKLYAMYYHIRDIKLCLNFLSSRSTAIICENFTVPIFFSKIVLWCHKCANVNKLVAADSFFLHSSWKTLHGTGNAVKSVNSMSLLSTPQLLPLFHPLSGNCFFPISVMTSSPLLPPPLFWL